MKTARMILWEHGIIPSGDGVFAETYVPQVHIENIIKAMQEYAQQFIDSARAIIDPALDILPETYDEEVDAWYKLIEKFNKEKNGK